MCAREMSEKKKKLNIFSTFFFSIFIINILLRQVFTKSFVYTNIFSQLICLYTAAAATENCINFYAILVQNLMFCISKYV